MKAHTEALEAQIRDELSRGELQGAATAAIRGYGPEILGLLFTVLHDEDDANEVFAQFSEALWKGIAHFKGESSLRTWAYRIAWRAAVHHRSAPHKRRVRRLGTAEQEALAQEVRSRTAPFCQTEAHDLLHQARAQLSPEEQAILVLRVDRRLSWATSRACSRRRARRFRKLRCGSASSA